MPRRVRPARHPSSPSSVIPYTLDLEALRRLPPQLFGILMSLDPAAAALVGLVVLGESLSPAQGAAVLCVVGASAGAALGARSVPRRLADDPDGG
jgi:inner membrane transporter RhtA